MQEQADYPQALAYHKAAEDILQGLTENAALKAATFHLLGHTHTALKNHDLAQKYLQEALSLACQIDSKWDQMNVYESLTNLYKNQDDYRQAFACYQKRMEIREELFNESKSKQIAELQTKYETEKKEIELERQQNELLLLTKHIALS